MKKVLVLVVAMVLLMGILVGCGSVAETQAAEEKPAAAEEKAPAAEKPAEEEAAPAEDETFFCGLAAQCTNGFYFKKYISRFEEICKEKGYEYVIMDANFDGPTQVGQIENMIAQEVDVIFLTTVDAEATVEPVKKAFDAGIPVVQGHCQIAEAGQEYTIGFAGSSPYLLGEGTAELIKKACDGKGNLVIIGSSWSSVDIVIYQECVDKMIAENEITVLTTLDHGWDRTKAYEAMENALTQYDNIDVVWSMDDNTAIGCVNAIKDAGREGIKVVGINGQDIAFDAIKAGEMYGTTVQNPGENVENMFALWDKWRAEEEYDFVSYSKSPMITAENVDDYEPAF